MSFWILAVILLPTIIDKSAYFFAKPPRLLKMQLRKFFCFATLSALMIFLDFPDVEIAIKTSPFFPSELNVLEKILLKPISLPVAVNVDVSIANDMAG